MRYFAIFPFVLIAALLWGQPIEEKRMKRDIEVAENILTTLIEDAASNTFQAYQVEGTYLESYGLLFTIQHKLGGFAVAPRVILDGNRIARGRAESGRLKERGLRGSASAVVIDTSAVLDQEKIKALSETFLADYGYLLTQLPDNERICIKYREGRASGFAGFSNLAFTIEDKALTAPGFTMVVSKKVVEDHRSGKIGRQALISKIEYSETVVESAETDRELVLLHSIFNRLYQRDLSDGFYIRGKGSMEKITGLGVLFSYRFSTKHHTEGLFFSNDQYRYYYYDKDEPGKRGQLRLFEEEPPKEEAEELEEPDFEAFLEDFKSNIIEYGSTVRDLKDDEVLSFELQLPNCSDCDDRPEKVKITAKKPLLEGYRKGQIELEEAVAQLQVRY